MSDIFSRWGIEESDNERWRKLKTRLKIITAGDDGNTRCSDVIVYKVAYELGEDISRIGSQVDRYDKSEWIIYTRELIGSTTNAFELSELLESLLNNNVFVDFQIRLIVELINKPGTGMNIKEVKNDYIIFPEGEKQLDEKLVSGPLSFLENKSKPLEEYRKALHHYSMGSWHECAEKTRRTLEEYLREKLANGKGLEANIKLLGRDLKSNESVPEHFRIMIIKLLKALDDNYNPSSKHQSNTYDEIESEMLIYQVGLLMNTVEKI